MSRTLFVLLCLVVVSVSARAAPPAAITVVLLDGSTSTVTIAMLESLQEIEVRATAHDETHAYTGYDIRSVLELAGAKPVTSLRGVAMRHVLIAEGEDGYAATFALAELDPAIGNRQVMLVHAMEGEPLPAATGPWRLVVPGDARPARWVRTLKRIELREIR